MSESKDRAIETVKKPLYATVGAGDAAAQAVADVVAKVRERAETTSTDVSGRVEEARERFATLSTDVREQIETLRQRLGLPSELPEWAELREKFTVEELRKVAEEYRRGAADLYADLVERGEGAVERLRTRPGLEQRIERAEDTGDAAADKIDEAKAAVATKAPAKKMTS